MAALISLCNQALSHVAAGQIASLSEASVEAREVNRHAQPLLDEMSAWSDTVALARARVLLAPAANDRPAEWFYAYALPADFGASIAVVSPDDAAASLPTHGPHNFPLHIGTPMRFIIEAGVIYTNVEAAIFYYNRNTLAAADLPPLGQKAFVDELAARLAYPVKKDIKLMQARQSMAEASRARWLAHEESQSPRIETRYVSEAEYARLGAQ